MQAFGNPTGTEYLQQANDNLLTIVQIETREALQNVDAIAKVPGVDVLFVGPYDLGNNIGHPILGGTMHPNLKQGVAKVLKAAIDNDKKAGFYCTSGRQAREYAELGFHLICVMTDVVALPQTLSSALAMAKGRKAAP